MPYLCFIYVLSMFQVCYKSEVIVRLIWSGVGTIIIFNLEKLFWPKALEARNKDQLWMKNK